MLKYYYETAKGLIIDFQSEIWSDYHWVYGYENESDITCGIVKNIKAKPFEKTIDLYIKGKSPSGTAKIRDNLCYLAQRDVDAETPGKLYVGNYYLECYIMGLNDVEASISLLTLHTEAKVVAGSACWKKRHECATNSSMTEAEESNLLEIKKDFAFDLMASKVDTITNPFSTKSDFEMVMYGPCNTPSVVIDGHTYRMKLSLASGEYVVIKSSDKTITKHSYSDAGSVINVFDKRYKEESIFKKIPTGTRTFSKSGSFDFDLHLIDSRVEPVLEG